MSAEVWVGGFAALYAAPYLREMLRPGMTDAIRQQAPGQVAALKRGQTHYQWQGPQDGPVAVCVHGLTTPSFVWGPIAQGLAGMGFRVLTYDLYGRGYSDRPRGEQDAAFFVAQLEGLLDHLGVTGKVTLLGYSMGGAISAAYAARHPERVRDLVLLAPAGMGHDLGPVARLVVNHRLLGRWLMMAFYARSYRRALAEERDVETSIPGVVELQERELRYRGFIPAVWQSLRGVLDEDMQPAHRVIAQKGVPVRAIWGADDEVIPLAGRDRLAHWNPDARQVVVPGATHALAYTHDAQVLGALRDLSDAQAG